MSEMTRCFHPHASLTGTKRSECVLDLRLMKPYIKSSLFWLVTVTSSISATWIITNWKVCTGADLARQGRLDTFSAARSRCAAAHLSIHVNCWYSRLAMNHWSRLQIELFDEMSKYGISFCICWSFPITPMPVTVNTVRIVKIIEWK